MTSERSWASLRQHRAEQAAIEDAQRLEREKPLRDAEAKLHSTATALGKFTRQIIATGKDVDAYIAPEVAGKRMSVEDARLYNSNQAKLFVEASPWFWPSESNKNTLFSYLTRNKIAICTSEMYRRAAEKLRDHGLLQEQPEPEPQPEPIQTPEPEPAPQIFTGIDQVTGQPREYTAWEVERMDSETFRRVFNLGKPRLLDARP